MPKLRKIALFWPRIKQKNLTVGSAVTPGMHVQQREALSGQVMYYPAENKKAGTGAGFFIQESKRLLLD
jgi:hypothetical protein